MCNTAIPELTDRKKNKRYRKEKCGENVSEDGAQAAKHSGSLTTAPARGRQIRSVHSQQWGTPWKRKEGGPLHQRERVPKNQKQQAHHPAEPPPLPPRAEEPHLLFFKAWAWLIYLLTAEFGFWKWAWISAHEADHRNTSQDTRRNNGRVKTVMRVHQCLQFGLF